MIRLEVREYCHDCFDFDPNVQSPERFYAYSDRVAGQTDTIVRCRSRARCENIRRFLVQDDRYRNGDNPSDEI